MPKLTGDRIAAARRAGGVTQEQLAARAGVSRQTLAALEHGQTVTRPVRAAVILALLAEEQTWRWAFELLELPIASEYLARDLLQEE